MTTPTPERDRFDDLVAEVLPCKYAHGWCGLMMDTHQSDCAAFRREEVAAALRSTDATARREAYEAGVRDAIKQVEPASLKHTSPIPGRTDDHTPCYFAQGHDCGPFIAGDIDDAIRALLNPSTEAEEGRSE